MAAVDWPNDLDTVLASGYRVRRAGEPNLWYPLNDITIPAFVDTATAVYWQDEFATTDSWSLESGGGGSLTVADGHLIFAKAAANEFIKRVIAYGAAYQVVKLKVRVVAGTPSSSVLTVKVSSSVSFTKTITIDGSWNYISALAATTGTRLELFVGSVDGAETYTLEVDYAYVGTGAYATPPTAYNCGSDKGSYDLAPYNMDTLEGAYMTDGVAGDAPIFAGHANSIRGTYPDSTAFTIAVWFKGTTAGNDTTTMGFLHLTRAANANRIALSLGSTGKFRCRWVTVAVATAYLESTATVHDGVWHRLVFSHDGTYARIYIDGALVNTSAASDLVASDAQNLVIGRAVTLSLPCTLDEVMLWTRAITDAEVATDYEDSAALYEALPDYPDADGFREVPQDGTLRSEMDTGPSKLRQRFTAVSTYYDMQYTLTPFQREVLDQFYRETTYHGSIPFNWTHPHGYEVEATFVGPPSYTPDDLDFVASMRFEVLP